MSEYSKYTYMYRCPECGYNDSEYDLVFKCCSRCGWNYIKDKKWPIKEIGRWRTEYRTVKFLWFFSRKEKYYVWEPTDTIPWYDISTACLYPQLKIKQ